MFARLLGLNQAPNLRPASNARRSRPLPGRPLPRLPDRVFLPEIELDRRLNYWAMTRGQPGTATVRLSLFESHLRVALDTDRTLELALVQIATADRQMANKAAGLRPILAEQVLFALESTGRVYKSPMGTRVGVVIKRFVADLTARLNAITNVDIRAMIDYMGADKIVDLCERSLREVSQEESVAVQLKQNAQTVRRLEDLITNAALPEEDFFELKLRRDLFTADLRIFSRLTKAALAVSS